MIKAVLNLYRYNPNDGYWFNLAVVFDCLCNSIALGDPDETISSRSAKARNEGKEWGCLLCRFLNIFQTGHCDKALERNKGGRAVIPD